MKTYDVNECADLLRVHRTTILELAGTGKLRGAKIGKSWAFLEEDVEAFLKQQVKQQADSRSNKEVPAPRFSLPPAVTRRRGWRRKPLPTLPNEK
jgi:excisionase family DNA binding protein